MASNETYDGTPATGVNAVVATSLGLEGSFGDSGRGLAEEENLVHGATGTTGHGGVEGVIISGHEDQFIRFFDANSGKPRQPLELFLIRPNLISRSMHIQHARPPVRHIVALAEQGRP
jgi:hypothetical protein